MFSSKVVLSLLALTATSSGFFVKEEDVIKGMDPNCPTVKHYTAVYHQDTACDRAEQNLFKDTLNRAGIQTKLHGTGTDIVPSQKTTFCPETVNPMTNKDAVTGFDTIWIMENTASTPVVVCFMAEQADGTFRETSAFDSKISPPNHDPKAILKPNEWKTLHTYEGHVFHVREILKDGSMGQVIMQHRVGLIPVSNKYGHELNCNPNDPDPEPKVVVDQVEIRDPDFAREAPRVMRPCNVLDIGFRNEVGCPLNAYYTGMYEMKGVAKPRGPVPSKVNTTVTAPSGYTPKSCHEVFKFHLGLQEKSNNFMFDWNSKTKYEGTYVGHNFVFRYAKDERIVVDSIAVHPTRIIDCPGLKNQINVASVSDGEAIMAGIGRRNQNGNEATIFSNGFVLPHLSMDIKNLNATTKMMTMNNTAIDASTSSPSELRRRRAASANLAAGVASQSL
jgi:hypothetical protein